MVIEEFITKFSFKADTSKVHNFSKKMNEAKEKTFGADSAFERFQDQLKKGIPNQWFQSMSSFITTFNRSRVFLNGFKNTFQILSKLPFGGMFKGMSDAITGIMLPMNRFGLLITRIRSSIRSWMHLMNTGWKQLWTNFKAHMAGIFSAMKVGLTKLGPLVKTKLLALKAWIGKTWNGIVAKVMAGNSKFLKAMISGIQKVGNFFNPKLAQFGKGIKKAAANIPVLGQALAGVPALALGAVAALGLIVGAIFVVVKAIKAIAAATKNFIEFETAMKGVQKVTLASAREMNQLQASAMAAGEASIFTVKEAAEAQKFLAMAGLSVKETMAALPGTLQLAAAGEMDLATAADIATNIMSSNALAVEDLTRINDIMAYTAANANTDIVQLGAAISKIGPAGKLAGLSVENLSAWLGVLANNGVRGERAGTMVRNAINDLVNPSEKMAKAMAEGGVAIGDFVDNTGNINDIDGFLKAMEDMDAISKKGFLASLDERTWQALAPVITGSAAAVGQLNAELEKSGGTAAKMAGFAFKGLSGAVKQYHSRMGAASVKFMKNSNLDKLFEDIVRFASDVLPPLIDTIGLVLRPFVVAIRILFTVLTAVGVLFKGIMNVVNVLGGFVIKALMWPLEKILDLFNFLMGYLRTFFDYLVNLQNGPLAAIINWITGLIDKLAGFFVKFKDWFGGEVSASTPSDSIGAGGGTSNSSTTNIAIDSPITINGTDTNNAPAVAAAARSAVAIEVRKILVEAGI